MSLRYLLLGGCIIAPPAFAVAQVTPTPPGASPVSPPPSVDAVVIKAQEPGQKSSLSGTSYKIGSDIAAHGGSIADALRNLPSVDVDVMGNVRLRGDPNVTILIDGRPAAQMEGAGRAQALQDLPADRIDRVEVMTTPSASYGGNGTGGVINLVTRKTRGLGASGSTKGSIGSHGRDALGMSYGFNGSRLSLASDVTYRRETQHQAIDDQRTASDGTGSSIDSRRRSTQDAAVRVANASASADYDVTEHTRLSSAATFLKRSTSFSNHEGFSLGNGVGFERSLQAIQGQEEASIEASFKHTASDSGQETYGSIAFRHANDWRSRSAVTSFAAPTPLLFEQQDTGNHLNRLQAKATYEIAAPHGARLKVGAEAQSDDNQYLSLGRSGAVPTDLPVDSRTTNDFVARQTVTSQYITYNFSASALTGDIGLRAEQARIELSQRTLGTRKDRDFSGVYPSAHVVWALSPSDRIQLGFSRRGQRPQLEQLNPFQYVLSPVTIRSGNPDLEQQTSEAIELSYFAKAGSGDYGLTLYSRRSRRLITDAITDLGNGVLLTRPENAAGSREQGVEFTASRKLSAAWAYSASASVYRARVLASGAHFADGQALWGASAKLAVSWTPTARDLVQINANLNGRRATSQGRLAASPFVSLGLKHDLTPTLSGLIIVQDALRSYRDRQFIDTPLLRARMDRDIDARTVLLRLVWTFAGRSKDNTIDLSQTPGASP